MDVTIAGESVPLQVVIGVGLFMATTSLIGGWYLIRIFNHVRRTGGWVSVADVIPGDIIGAALIGNFFLLHAVAQIFAALSPQENTGGAPSSLVLLFNLLIYLAIYLFMGGMLAITMKKRGTTLTRFLGLDKPPLSHRMGKGILILLAAWPVMITLGVLWQQMLTHVFGLELNAQDPVRMMMEITEPLGLVSMILMTVVIAPIGEELAFRGYLYPVAKRYIGRWPAMFATSLLFGLVHGNWAVGFALALFGFILALAYEHTGSLITAITMHMVFNGLNTVLIFVSMAAAQEVPITPEPPPPLVPHTAPAGLIPFPPGWEHAFRALVEVE